MSQNFPNKTVLGLAIEVKDNGHGWELTGQNAASVAAQLKQYGIAHKPIEVGHVSVELGNVQTAIAQDRSGVAQRILDELNAAASMKR